MDHPRFQCALVTGASAGLGEEFARQLAGRCRMLVLVARRTERLDALAADLRGAHPRLAVHVIGCDLAEAGQRLDLVDTLAREALVPDLLVNNAGLGDHGEFLTADWTRIDSMLKVNIEALTHLTHLLLPGMVAQAEVLGRNGWRGAVINVSSLASIVPIPDFAVYAATKAYVTSFSEALRIELRGSRIPVLAVCPGPVHTEFGELARRPGEPDLMGARKVFYVPKEQVVAESLVTLGDERARVFPGWQVAAAAALIGLLPMALIRLAMSARPRRSC